MTEWHYHDPAQGGRVGPVSDDTLRTLYRERRIEFDTLVWHPGLGEWTPLERQAEALSLYGLERVPLPPPLPPTLPPHLHGGSPASPMLTPPPARKGLSGCAIALIVGAALLIPMLAILAAIALPAYQHYVTRSKVAQAISQVAPLKASIVAAADAQSCPDNDSPGFGTPESYAAGTVASITIGSFEDSDLCGMELQLRDGGKQPLDGGRIWLEHDPQSGDWTCSSSIDDRYLPPACRG